MGSTFCKLLSVFAGMTALLFLIATSRPGGYTLLVQVSALTALVIGIIWLLGAGRSAFGKGAAAGTALLVVPLIFAMSVGLKFTDTSLRLRFAFAVNAFDAQVETIPLNYHDTVNTLTMPDSLGGYSLGDAHRSGRGIFIQISDDGWNQIGRDGFAYLPDGVTSTYKSRTWWEPDYTHLSGHWFAYNTTPNGLGIVNEPILGPEEERQRYAEQQALFREAAYPLESAIQECERFSGCDKGFRIGNTLYFHRQELLAEQVLGEQVASFAIGTVHILENAEPAEQLALVKPNGRFLLVSSRVDRE